MGVAKVATMSVWSNKEHGLLIVGRSHITSYGRQLKKLRKELGDFTVLYQSIYEKAGELIVDYMLRLEAHNDTL